MTPFPVEIFHIRLPGFHLEYNTKSIPKAQAVGVGMAQPQIKNTEEALESVKSVSDLPEVKIFVCQVYLAGVVTERLTPGVNC